MGVKRAEKKTLLKEPPAPSSRIRPARLQIRLLREKVKSPSGRPRRRVTRRSVALFRRSAAHPGDQSRSVIENDESPPLPIRRVPQLFPGRRGLPAISNSSAIVYTRCTSRVRLPPTKQLPPVRTKESKGSGESKGVHQDAGVPAYPARRGVVDLDPNQRNRRKLP